MKKYDQFISEAKGYGDVNRQVASAQDKVDRAQAKNVTTKGKKLGMLADPYSGKPTKQEVWEYKGKKWLVLGKSVEVFVPMKYHKVISERRQWRPDDFRVGQEISYEIGTASNWKTGKIIRKGGKYTGTIISTYVPGEEDGTLVVKNSKTGKSEQVWMHSVIDILKHPPMRLGEEIERIDEVTKAEVKQLTTKLNSLKRKGFKVHIGDQPKWFWATANKMKADKSHKAEIDAIIKAFKAKLDYSMPGDERGDFTKTYKTASGIEIEFERVTEYDKTKTLSISVTTDIIKELEPPMRLGESIEPINEIFGTIVPQKCENPKKPSCPGYYQKNSLYRRCNMCGHIKYINEEAPANAAGSALGSNPSTGSIAGYDPMLSKTPLKRSKFAGTECFEVDSDTFNKCRMGHMKGERWNKYLKDDCPQCQAIHAYSQRHPQKDIVIQNQSVAGEMCYLKKKNIHY